MLSLNEEKSYLAEYTEFKKITQHLKCYIYVLSYFYCDLNDRLHVAVPVFKVD